MKNHWNYKSTSTIALQIDIDDMEALPEVERVTCHVENIDFFTKTVYYVVTRYYNGGGFEEERFHVGYDYEQDQSF